MKDLNQFLFLQQEVEKEMAAVDSITQTVLLTEQ